MITNFLHELVSKIGQPVGQIWFGVTQRFTTCEKTQTPCRSSGGHDSSRAANASKSTPASAAAVRSGPWDDFFRKLLSAAISTSFSSRHLAPEACRRRLPHAFPKTLLAVVVASGSLLTAQGPRSLLAPITRDEVWQAVTLELRQRGVREEQLLRSEEIDLPAAVMAAPSHTLRVSMVCWDADLGRAQFQLACRQAGQCVPFLAYAGAGRSTAMGSERIAGSSCRAASRARSEPAAQHRAVIRVGDRATVVFRGSQLNLTALVTCLERGAEGEIIRVRNQDGQIFRARVSAPARLEALP